MADGADRAQPSGSPALLGGSRCEVAPVEGLVQVLAIATGSHEVPRVTDGARRADAAGRVTSIYPQRHEAAGPDDHVAGFRVVRLDVPRHLSARALRIPGSL